MIYRYTANRSQKHVAMDTHGHTPVCTHMKRFTKTHTPILKSLWEADKPTAEQGREGELHTVMLKLEDVWKETGKERR